MNAKITFEMDVCEHKKFKEEPFESILTLWSPKEIKYYLGLILWKQTTK